MMQEVVTGEVKGSAAIEVIGLSSSTITMGTDPNW